MTENSDEPIHWIESTHRDDIRLGRRGTQTIVEWRGIGRLYSSSSGADSEFSVEGEVDPIALKKFRVTSLTACRRYLAGSLSLHGSAVGLPFGSVVLVGDCGAGKSTTGMALVERCGGNFLADDIVPIDWDGSVPFVSPVDDCFWLTRDASAWFGLEDSPTDKRPCPPRARATAAERLRAVVHLAFDESVAEAEMRPVTGGDAFEVLSFSHVCYSTGGDEDSLRNFRARARLAGATRVFRLRRRRTLQTLGMAAELLAKGLSIACEPKNLK
jgi:hypothetical protein